MKEKLQLISSNENFSKVISESKTLIDQFSSQIANAYNDNDLNALTTMIDSMKGTIDYINRSIDDSNNINNIQNTGGRGRKRRNRKTKHRQRGGWIYKTTKSYKSPVSYKYKKTYKNGKTTRTRRRTSKGGRRRN